MFYQGIYHLFDGYPAKKFIIFKQIEILIPLSAGFNLSVGEIFAETSEQK